MDGLLSQEEMLVRMERDHGRACKLAELTVYLTFRELVDQFGPACEDYEPLCVCCRAHLQWQTTGKVTFKIGRDAALGVLDE